MENEDPKYPIYSVSAGWVIDGDQAGKSDWEIRDLPAGRIWSGTGLRYRMYRTNPGYRVVSAEAHEWWRRLWLAGWREIQDADADKNPSDFQVKVDREPDATWCPDWFGHWTFDVGQSENDALVSLRRLLYPEGTKIDRIHQLHRCRADGTVRIIDGLTTI